MSTLIVRHQNTPTDPNLPNPVWVVVNHQGQIQATYAGAADDTFARDKAIEWAEAHSDNVQVQSP